jgi:plasmid replication initiation protein
MPRKKSTNDKVIKKKTKVTVSNTLNQMIFEQKDMNLQAFRMLMFYLAKINPARPDLTEVRVPLETYAEMLGVELNEQAIDASTNMLLGYVLKTGRVDAGDYIILNAKYSVFSVCRLTERKSDGKRMLEFKCSEDVKPLIFEMQSKFTMFNVWNVLNLSNFQDIRMYMLLSQYKVAGARTFTLDELKDKLGISREAYPEFKIFSRAVLKKCQKALKERTDICFDFKAVGRPAHSVYFEIFPNDEYTILKYLEEIAEPLQLHKAHEYRIEQLSIDDVEEDVEEREEMERGRRSDLCDGLQDQIFDPFTFDELTELVNLAKQHLNSEDVYKKMKSGLNHSEARDLLVFTYIKSKVLLCNASRNPVEHRYSFVKKAVMEDWK